MGIAGKNYQANLTIGYRLRSKKSLAGNNYSATQHNQLFIVCAPPSKMCTDVWTCFLGRLCITHVCSSIKGFCLPWFDFEMLPVMSNVIKCVL